MRRVPVRKDVAPVAEDSSAVPPAEAVAPWLAVLSQRAVLCALVFALSLAIYWNTLGHEFTYDDVAAVRRNPVVTGDTPWREVFWRDFWGTPTRSTLSHKSYRPLTSLLFRALWALGGDSPALFHAVLVVGNAATTALAVACVLGGFPPLVRVVAALLYACHPIKTEAVAGVVGTAEVLCAALCFAAFASRGRPLLAAALCYAASMAKETGITVSLLIALHCYHQQRLDATINKSNNSNINKRGGKSGARSVAQWLRVAMVPAISLALFCATRLALFGRDNWAIEPSPQDNPMLRQRGVMWAVNAVVVQAQYVWLLLWPAVLSCDYSYNALPLAQSLLSGVALFGAGVAVATLAVMGRAWREWRRDARNSALLLGCAWYAAPMVPATHIMVIGTLVAERLLYVPLLGACIVAGVACARACRGVAWRQAMALAFVLLISGGLAARAVERNRDWRSNDVLFERTAATVPHSIKALMNLAAMHFARGDVAQLQRYCARVLRIDEHYCAALQLQARAQQEFARNATQAERLYNATLACMLPRRHSSHALAEVYEALGSLAVERRDYEGSLPLFARALQLDNDDAGCNYCVALQHLKRYAEAVEPSLRCIRAGTQIARLDSEYARVHAAGKLRNHGFLMRSLGRKADAIEAFERAVAVNPKVRYDKEIADLRG